MKKNYLIWLTFLSLISIICFTTYHIFNKPNYKITFNSNGGNKIKSIEIKKDTTLESLPIPIKNGYEFLGWYLNDSPYNLNEPITKNINLIAKWNNILTKTYKIRFDTLSDTKFDDIIVEENTIIEDFPTPIKEEYKFLGWYYHNKEFDFNTPITSNITLIAKYEKEID
ncbi:MAG: InlB B-repeat-containing protein [Ruminococcus sp.]|nr:InlB B-repeat-containing protein [Ruminococcus sp.]